MYVRKTDEKIYYIVNAGHFYADSFYLYVQNENSLEQYIWSAVNVHMHKADQDEKIYYIVKAGHLYADSFLIRAAPCFLYKGRALN